MKQPLSLLGKEKDKEGNQKRMNNFHFEMKQPPREN